MIDMNTSQAVSEFGSVRALAKELGVTVQAVYGWGETVPRLRQYQIRELLARRVDLPAEAANAESDKSL